MTTVGVKGLTSLELLLARWRV